MDNNLEKDLRDCFKTAKKEEEKGRKHKGLLLAKPNISEAKDYLKKARDSLELCEIYKERRYDYKIPEEWFYSLYYCALSILSKFGIESRSQKYTALFLEYLISKGIIDYNLEFIRRITVHHEKGIESEVDKREEARYGHFIRIDSVFQRYKEMTDLCKEAIFQAETIIFSEKNIALPQELFMDNCTD